MEKSKHTWVRVEDVGELGEFDRYTTVDRLGFLEVVRVKDFEVAEITHVLDVHLGPIPECDG